MKALAILLSLAASACAVQSDVDPAEQATAVSAISTPEATTSVWWNRKMTVADLWPAELGITSAQVLYRKAADSSTGPTFVAFVVWNGDHVGKILRVHLGTDGPSFHAAVQAMIGQRVAGHDGSDSSSGGSTTAGNGKPTPHPNVDGPIVFPEAYLNNVRNNAAIIHNAYVNFMSFEPALPVGLPSAE